MKILMNHKIQVKDSYPYYHGLIGRVVGKTRLKEYKVQLEDGRVIVLPREAIRTVKRVKR